MFDTENSSLPGDEVWSIDFDTAGRAWLATWDHVACFDGERWTVYDRQRLAVAALVYLSSVGCDNKANAWVGLLQFDGAACDLKNSIQGCEEIYPFQKLGDDTGLFHS